MFGAVDAFPHVIYQCFEMGLVFLAVEWILGGDVEGDAALPHHLLGKQVEGSRNRTVRRLVAPPRSRLWW